MNQSLPSMCKQKLLDQLHSLAWLTGDASLEVYSTEDFGKEVKGEDSTLTNADLAADQLLVDGLSCLTPEILAVNEEGVTSLNIPKSNRLYWLFDPLDGTKEFLNRNNAFTCNLVLIENHQPVLGFVGVPASNELFIGAEEAPSKGIEKAVSSIPIEHTQTKDAEAHVVTSNSPSNKDIHFFIGALRDEIALVEADCSLKPIKVATQFNGKALHYGKDTVVNPLTIARARSC